MKATTNDLKLLLVEDNPADVFLLRQMLKSSALPVSHIQEASHLGRALHILQQHPVDIILLDLSLPDSFGVASFMNIRTVSGNIPIIILTGLSDTQIALQAIKAGAQDYLVKGEFNAHSLTKSIQYSIERMHNLEKLRESEEKYRLMFDKNPFPSIIIDKESLSILEVNESALTKYGYTKEEFALLKIFDLRLPEDVPALAKKIVASAPESAYDNTVRHRGKNGQVMIMEGAFYAISYMGKSAIQAQMNDITEKVKLERDLDEERRQRQRQVTSAVLEAQEKERKSIGEELHDNINQIITSARLYIDLSMKKGKEADPYLEKAMLYTGMAIEENRKLSKSLILPQLKGAGLIASLEELRQELKHSSALNIKFFMAGFDENDFLDTEKISLYRIVQEQLNNVLKYAEAKTVLIRLYRENGNSILVIKDNGKGFNTHVRSKGVGLTNICSRAEVLKGKVVIESAPGQGCILKVTIPHE